MLSIIIPVLNEEKYLPMLLESIKKQTYNDYEVIVIDSHSKDKTIEIAKEFGCRIKEIRNGSPAKGRNAGAKIAKGELFLFLDADVILTKDFLKENVAEFKKRDLKVASCLIKTIGGNIIDKFMHDMAGFLMFVLQRIMPSAPGFCIFIDKSVCEEINGFDENLKISEDADFVRKAGKKGRFGLLRSEKIHVSMRRFSEEGRIKVYSKHVISFIYSLFNLKMKGKLFDYKWGKHD